MRTALLLPLIALAVMAGCGDDDTETPDAGDYYGGVRDTTEALQMERTEVQTAPSGDEVTLAPRYRAEAEAFREYGDALDELEPPETAAEQHETLVAASYAIADGLDELADLVEEEPQSEDLILAQQEVQNHLSDQAFEWNAACVGLDLKTQEDIACNVVVAAE
jgi:hypothetical protein